MNSNLTNLTSAHAHHVRLSNSANDIGMTFQSLPDPLPKDFFDPVDIFAEDPLETRHEKHLWNLLKYLCQRQVYAPDVYSAVMWRVLRDFMWNCFVHPEDPRRTWLLELEPHLSKDWIPNEQLWTWNDNRISAKSLTYTTIAMPDSYVKEENTWWFGSTT